jgi:ribose transport system substrate-binding protein
MLKSGRRAGGGGSNVRHGGSNMRHGGSNAGGGSNVRRGAMLLTVFASALLVACSSTSGTSSGPAAGGNGSNGSSSPAGGAAAANACSGIVATAQAKVQSLRTDVTTWPSLPATPPKPHAKIFVISISQQAGGAAQIAAAARSTGAVLGWDVTVVDGQDNPTVLNDGIQRAVTQKADGIMLDLVPAELVESSLAAAKAAGIPVVSVLQGNQVTATSPVRYENGSVQAQELLGQDLAWAVIAKSDGKANVVIMENHVFALSPPTYVGMTSVLSKCACCKVVGIGTYAASDLGTDLAGITAATLARYPSANWVLTDFDAAALDAVQGVRQSGRTGVQVGSIGGDAANLALIRSGDIQSVDIAQPLPWFTWDGLYQLNRLMQGETTVPVTVPVKLLDASNLPPAGQTWDGDFDVFSIYLKSWGK